MVKNLLLWLVIAAILVSVFTSINPSKSNQTMSYSQFIDAVQKNHVENVEINNTTILGKLSGGSDFKVVRPPIDDPQLINDLLEHNVTVEGLPPERQSIWVQLLVASFPILIIIAVFMFFMRQMQGGPGGGKGGPMAFGKSKARLLAEDQIKTTFADVAGCDEAKEDVQEVVDFLRDPGKYQRLGGQIPRGMLLVGPPGTGKTLLAKAVAGEAKVPFFSISGSDFVEMFVGVGASRVRDMFEQAKKQSPCIIFIDEIDAVGRHRGSGMGGGHDEREQTLNQLLVEMDGFEGNDGVIVVAATNRADVLDSALLRPGRFDRQVVVGLPDIRGREQILKVHLRKVPAADDVQANVIARGTPGFSGAELANLVNEASLFAARSGHRMVSMAEFEQARDKIMMGAERKTMVMSEKEKETTAYHEAGHAIIGYLAPEHDPVHKVTIIPRGQALGVTHFLPEADRISESRLKLLGGIETLYGGRIAEEMMYGLDGISTGASSDIQMATRYARAMVTQWGFAEDQLGPVLYSLNEQTGREDYSAATAEVIDNEVKRIINDCYTSAQKTLKDNEDVLHAMKEALMEYETLDSHQVDDLMQRRQVRPPKDWDDGSGDSADSSGVETGKLDDIDGKKSDDLPGSVGDH
ncbi:ATP-dependent zinc metalloprotease FtsH [BD1-7 clade bacterium]|uniref:ATP-dependent zinc metalloprotease FtsH n=1 Tax=BD1-7 clade bacterium TaxID=2029982 RepID=A0A5S9MSJ8_9GAMM|nr:ATP-dependent zinc metalloprotease FtsH [BD1-7 clade bacterium]CAA0084311.1 ATP-dependent zinc metalloprotease FtsH [BD1-7 clade bacterium]